MASGDDKRDIGNESVYSVPIFYEGNEVVELETETSARRGPRGQLRATSRGNSIRGQRSLSRGRVRKNQFFDFPRVLPTEERTESNTQSNRGKIDIRSRGRGHRHRRASENINREHDRVREQSGSKSDLRFNISLDFDKEHNGVRSGRGLKPAREFSESSLVMLSKKDNSDEVLLEIGNTKSGFFEFIRKPLNPDLVYYTIRLLHNVSNAKMQDVRRREILKEVEAHFLHQLNELLNLVSLKDPKTLNVWNSTSNLSNFLTNISKLLCAIITTLPSSLGKCKGVITAVKEVVEVHNVEGIEESLKDVEEVLRRETEAKQNLRTGEGHKIDCTFRRTGTILIVPENPPDDFRKISILPTLEDLQEEIKPFLRANKVSGKYENLDTYLDVQFRLLREDYMQPLRNGIAHYKHLIKEGVAVTKLRDIRLYHSVQILQPVCSGRGINHVLQFDMKNLRQVNWASSRRLMYGSLVCLSKDNFDTIIYATITDRDTTELSQGNILVYFENKNDLQTIKPTDVFVMAETTAYFEAYRHVLQGLKEMDENMPLQSYVIACETDIQSPKYLKQRENVMYNFSYLLHEQKTVSLTPILQTDDWPSAADLNLDSSQYEALQLAITKELAVIQGPPGTGKTYVGLKIVQLLLKNINRWTDDRQRCPILVVCYTNHALDQFLEGVSQFSNSQLVRVGGRCKNENLEPFILRNIKQTRRENKERSFGMTQSERDHRGELNDSETRIEIISSIIKQTSTNVISYLDLEEFMNENQRNMFKKAGNDWFLRRCMAYWIGVFETVEGTKASTLAQKYKHVWEQTILQTVRKLPKHERDCLDSPWNIETVKRAELYKTWISEFDESLHNSLLRTRKTHRRGKPKNKLEKLLLKSTESILDIETLLKHVSSPRTRKEIQMLFAGRCVSINKLLLYWLDLLEREQSIPYIKKALEDISSIDENGEQEKEISYDEGEDIEEDRKLDEDDDLLLNYQDKKRKKEPKVKNDQEAWILNVSAKQTAYKIKELLNSAKKLNQEEADSMTNVWELEKGQRRDLYAYWILQYRQKLQDQVKSYEEIFNNATEKLEEVRNMETVEILKEADVIGMTTTGAAKNRRLLKAVRPKIIIVEEAAEVLESHIITTLNENCQHLILIGDHKQLRPSTTVYELSKRYKLDVSLFERMVQNKIPCVTLQEQHRMRPEISCLLKNERLYPTLKDHDSVHEYDRILGVDVNIQFIDHQEPELTPEDTTSYCNPHEAQYIAGLCMYFLNQGYSPSQITVITPYMAQVQLLRRVMPKSLYEGVRITAVDNFQGEENDIILLSLVRSSYSASHRRNKIGFVGIENRICVSLSRAKRGLYVVGNFQLLEQNSDLWHDIIQLMKRKGAVKSELTLRCQNHPETFVLAKDPKDFEKFPLGGCGRSCRAELPCGHNCPKSCHPVDNTHTNATCERPCEKIVCDEGHKCTKSCWKECGDCCTFVEKKVPACGHTTFMKCSADPNEWDCKEVCTVTLECGHPCNKKCFECKKSNQHEDKCKEEVEKCLPCMHKEILKCFESVETFECKMPCDVILDCKHKCTGNCSFCLRGRIHGNCNGTCNKVLPCGHLCSSPCSEPCPPCTRRCDWKCSHGFKCQKKCWQKCDNCHEDCKFRCNHQRCEHKCHEKCKEGPCQERCHKKLNCAHICRGMCSESCICIICSASHIRKISNEEFDEGAVFIQLPNCSCIFEIHRLDRHMNTSTISTEGKVCKTCPHCSKPIKAHIRRYSNILKETRANIAQNFLSISTTNIGKRQLLAEISSLNRLGLKDLEIKELQSIAEGKTFGILHKTKQSVDRLKKLLEIERTILIHPTVVNIFTENDLIKPEVLRIRLVHVRTFSTSQFWTEIDRELSRLNQSLGDFQVREIPRLYTDRPTRVGMKLKQELEGLKTNSLPPRNKSASDLRTRNIADDYSKRLKDMRTQAQWSRTKYRQKLTQSAHSEQTSDYEIALGSDSVDSIEPTNITRTSQVFSRDMSPHSDSSDLSRVKQRPRSTQRQETTSDALSDADESLDKVRYRETMV